MSVWNLIALSGVAPRIERIAVVLGRTWCWYCRPFSEHFSMFELRLPQQLSHPKSRDHALVVRAFRSLRHACDALSITITPVVKSPTTCTRQFCTLAYSTGVLLIPKLLVTVDVEAVCPALTTRCFPQLDLTQSSRQIADLALPNDLTTILLSPLL